MDRKTKGRLGEAAVLKYCAEQGYEAYLPFFDCSKYDMLIIIDGQPMRTTIKFTSDETSSGKWQVDLRQSSRRSNNTMQIQHFDKSQYDLLAVYIGPEDRVVLVPCEFANKSTINIS